MTTKRFWQIGSASFTIIFVLVLVVSAAQAQWTASISVQNFDPRHPETKNVSFGVHPNATDGFDPGLDVITELPPAPSPGQPYLNVGFAGPGMTYFSTDIRPADPWWLMVDSSGTLTISWDTSSVPVDIPLSMKSSDGRTIDMKATASAVFEKGSYSMVIKEGKYGDLSGNKEITAFDASLVLQYIVGLINLSPEQKIAADVTGDKTVSALDAAMILQFTVGLITQLPIEPITAAPTSVVIEQLETVSLDKEQKQVLEQLKNLLFNQLPPTKTALLQNYPNPFNPETWLPYQLAQNAFVAIRIYNAEGKLIRILNLGMKQAGVYINRESAAYWDGRDNLGEETASGVYFYTLQVEHPDEDGTDNFIATRKMLLIK